MILAGVAPGLEGVRSQITDTTDSSASLTCLCTTESAQTRLTYIAGIRDDLDPRDYTSAPATAIDEDLVIGALQDGHQRDFHSAPDFASDDLMEDVRAMLTRLRDAGLHEAIAVDLTRPEFGIPVLRVVIPGLEGDSSHHEYCRGVRAQQAMAAS